MCKIYDKVNNKRELMAILNIKRNRKFSLTLRPSRDFCLFEIRWSNYG
jgi:hypothetical protein